MEPAGEGETILSSELKRVKLFDKIDIGRGFTRIHANQEHTTSTDVRIQKHNRPARLTGRANCNSVFSCFISV